MTGADWPYCETVEALRARARRRHLIGEVVGIIITVIAVVAVWPGLHIYALATMPGA